MIVKSRVLYVSARITAISHAVLPSISSERAEGKKWMTMAFLLCTDVTAIHALAHCSPAAEGFTPCGTSMLCSLSTCCWLGRNWRAWAVNQNDNTVTLWFWPVSRTKLAWLCKPFHPGMTGNYHRCWYSRQWMILEIEYPVTCMHLSAPIQVWSNKCWANDRWISCC